MPASRGAHSPRPSARAIARGRAALSVGPPVLEVPSGPLGLVGAGAEQRARDISIWPIHDARRSGLYAGCACGAFGDTCSPRSSMVAFVSALFGWPRLYRLALGPDLSGASPKEPAALRARRGQRTLCHLSDANGLAPGQQLSQLFLGDCERGTQRNGLKKGVEAFLILPCSSFLAPRSPVGSLVFSRVCWVPTQTYLGAHCH